MSKDRSHQMDFKGLELVADEFTGTVNGALSGVTVLTNSTGVTPDSTVENVPAATAASSDTSAASLTSTNASLTAIENSLSDLAAKVNAIINAMN